MEDISLNIVFIAIAVVFGLAFIFDKMRGGDDKSNEKSFQGSNPYDQSRPSTANEAMPTETGRFRVQQVLEQAKKDRLKKESQAVVETAPKPFRSSDGEPLPDPFSLDIDGGSDGNSK